jgi:hypothetical protein
MPNPTHPENADEFRKKMATIIYRAVESGESGWPANKELEVIDDIDSVHQQSIVAERAKAVQEFAEQLKDNSIPCMGIQVVTVDRIDDALARNTASQSSTGQEDSHGTVE